MFTELRPLLASRSLTITIAALGHEQIRVNVIPLPRPDDAKINEQIKYTHKDEVTPVPDTAIKALTTPISLTGTAEEIDEKFSAVLLRFVESHAQLQAAFDRASGEISEAVKAIDERNKNKLKTKSAAAKTEQKDEAKTRVDDNKPKSDDTLPLWWTTKSVPATGTAASQVTATMEPPVDGSPAATQSGNAQEVSQ